MSTKAYRIWAPRAKRVELVLFPDEERVPLRPSAGGWHEVEHPRIGSGQQYAVSLDGGAPLPDPRSPHQPTGVHGPSRWVDFDEFQWSDAGFQQCPLTAAVIYELHVGTFTPEGSFEAVIERLPHLRELGITHLELMPVAHFPTSRGWGYDGVCLFAPHTAYGGPEGLQRLVDACHAQGIAVLLDVVYNHLGPSGNYLSRFGPYFTDKYHTPWGEALNFDEADSHEVRRFVCDNAVHWLRHYHIDGLRLDAVHAIFDQSATHILEELTQRVDHLSGETGRHFVVIAESELNDPRFVRPPPAGYGVHAQWSDDFHHALHALLTREQDGYYADFGAISDLAEALRHGFVFRGKYSRHRRKRFGADSEGLRGRHFVVFAQNHDQVGNRAIGDRLAATLDAEQLKIAAALTLLSPFVPQLFMGEEWGSETPFSYFTDHAEPELAEAIRRGRHSDFAAFGWKPHEVPDPQAESTFERSRLDWDDLRHARHRELFEWHVALLQLRRHESSLSDDRLARTQVHFDEERRWLTMRRGELTLACNFGETAQEVPLPPVSTQLLLSSRPGAVLRNAHALLPGPSCAVVRFGRPSSEAEPAQ